MNILQKKHNFLGYFKDGLIFGSVFVQEATIKSPKNVWLLN